MKLSPHFSLREFVRSQLCSRHGWNNIPDEQTISNMVTLCTELMEPVRTLFGNRAIMVSSGYRCLKLNRFLKSKDTSHHRLGFAVDFEIPSLSNEEVYNTIKNSELKWTQLILEFHEPGDPSSGWVHLSYVPWDLRCESFIVKKHK